MPSNKDLDYSKWDEIGDDTDEEICAAPEQRDPHGLKSWMRKSAQALEENRKNVIIGASVQYEKEKAKREGKGTKKTNSCWTCYSANATLRCSKCKLVYFCSKECQTTGWKAHKFQCREISECEVKRIKKEEEYEEMLIRRAREEELEYGPRGELGPVQKLLRKESAQNGFHNPPMRRDGSLRVAVIIPFREQLPLQERHPHLARLIPHLESILSRLVRFGNLGAWKILVVEQASDGRNFNRGALVNAGFDYLDKSGEIFEQVILHDADLFALDENTQVWYGVDIPSKFLIHLTAEGYPKHMGDRATPGASRGVVAIRWEDFKESNGYPTDVWGFSENIEDRIWAERLGDIDVRYFPSPVGTWQDADRVDFRQCEEAREEKHRWYDSVYLRTRMRPKEPVRPVGPNGQIAEGPAVPPDEEIDEDEILAELADRSGGLDSISYTVLKEETFHVHSLKIEVLL